MTALGAFTEIILSQGDYFDHDRDVIFARAPGRLDVMGGIADYSGSLVLQLPLAAATTVAVQAVDEPALTVRSVAEGATVAIPLDELARCDLPTAHARLTERAGQRWIAYVAGALVVLRHERGISIDRGAHLLVHSTVPIGKGVASSAALEVASMQALAALYDLTLDGRELALLCQRVENVIVGAPCGVMDQMTSALGEENRLLSLLCQPAEVQGQVAIPEDVELWGIDSGIRHRITGSDYIGVRTGAFMGYRILADLAGWNVRNGAPGHVEVEDSRWRGYLANLTPDEWQVRWRHHVPVEMTGEEFLHRYYGTTDPVTHVAAKRIYAIRAPTEHPICEHHRVSAFRRLLEGDAHSVAVREQFGALMFESHESYNACGLGSAGTDQLVEMVRSAGVRSGLYGAKITGGGSGGVVAVLAKRGSRPVIEEIAARYSADTELHAHVLGGSSSGAMRSGISRVTV